MKLDPNLVDQAMAEYEEVYGDLVEDSGNDGVSRGHPRLRIFAGPDVAIGEDCEPGYLGCWSGL